MDNLYLERVSYTCEYVRQLLQDVPFRVESLAIIHKRVRARRSIRLWLASVGKVLQEKADYIFLTNQLNKFRQLIRSLFFIFFLFFLERICWRKFITKYLYRMRLQYLRKLR